MRYFIENEDPAPVVAAAVDYVTMTGDEGRFDRLSLAVRQHEAAKKAREAAQERLYDLTASVVMLCTPTTRDALTAMDTGDQVLVAVSTMPKVVHFDGVVNGRELIADLDTEREGILAENRRLLTEKGRLENEVDNWRETARQYAENAEFWLKERDRLKDIDIPVKDAEIQSLQTRIDELRGL